MPVSFNNIVRGLKDSRPESFAARRDCIPICRNIGRPRNVDEWFRSIYKRQTILWWYCRRCPPLPIPNREVKPAMADGTAPQCGRVGSRHIHSMTPWRKLQGVFRLYGFQYRREIADKAVNFLLYCLYTPIYMDFPIMFADGLPVFARNRITPH